jgi:hypothetical protein
MCGEIATMIRMDKPISSASIPGCLPNRIEQERA